MSVDNVEDITPRVQYTALLGQTVFPYPFPIFEDSDVVVDVDGVTKALSTHYTVDGEGEDTGGNVTFLVAPGSGAIVTVYRDIPIERTTDFQTNGPNSSRALNDELDKFIMIQQQLESRLGRTVRLALTNPQPDAELELGANFAGRYLFVNDDGELEPAASVAQTTLTNTIIRTILEDNGYGFNIHPLETAAGLVAADLTLGFMVGALERYKMVGDGVTNDSAGLLNASKASAQGIELLGTGGKTYLITSSITLTGSLKLNLQGATLKPSGNARVFVRNAPNGTAATTVSSGATIGSRTVVVASATGLVVGQWAAISADDAPTHDAFSYPYWFSKIVSIVGTTITLDHPAPVTYAGTISFAAYNAALIFSRFECSNGRVDGSATTFSSDTGDVFRIGGYEEVVLDNVTFKNCDNVGAFAADLQIYVCVDVSLTRLRWEGGTHDSSSNVADVQAVRSVTAENCVFDGSHFGINLTRAETARAINNTLIGRRDKEAGSPNSTRGLKFYGCASVIALGNYSTDFESPLKVQACFQYDVSHNHVRNVAPNLAYDGSIAINCSSITGGTNMRRSRVCDNNVENAYGVGIGIDSDAQGGVVVNGNIVSGSKGMGIYANVNNAIIIGNRVEDWGLRNSADPGIHYSQGATVIGNRFSHATLTTLPCLRNFLQSTFKYFFDGNICETANPIGITLEASGTAAVANGATNTGAITHGLSRTPSVAEIVVTLGGNPTNDPGIVYLSAVGATTFQINVRADPGASGASISWNARIKQPFTA